MTIRIFADHSVHAPGLERLQQIPNVVVDCFEDPRETSRDLPRERIAEAEVLFCLYPPANFEEMRRLQWIQISSAGYAQLFPLKLPGRGIRATNGRGNFDIPIAEWNVAMMVNLARNLRQMIRNQHNAVWDRSAVFQKELRGSVVGLWGYGGIGRETARLARGMGLSVHVFTRSGVKPRRDAYTVPGTGDPDGVLPHRVFTAGQEVEFLAGLDFLIVAMPLTNATEGLIGERELQALPRTAYILNPARGPIIQQQALLRALEDGWIAGAALDTHYEYPLPPEHPLWRFPQVILTPHISGSTLSPRFGERVWDIFVQNAERYAAGRPLLNELTAAELSGA